MLARLGKYEQIWALSIVHVTHIDHVQGFVSYRLDKHVNVSHGCVFLGGGLQDWRHFMVDWQRLSMTSHLKTDPKSTSIWTLMVLRHWAAIPVWTHTLFLSLFLTHTNTHTHWEEDRCRHISLRTTLKLAFVPERHFDVTNGAIHGLNTLNHCVGRSFMTMLSCFTAKQYWIQPLCSCKMYLPVHFVYKKPGMGIGICFFLYK